MKRPGRYPSRVISFISLFIVMSQGMTAGASPEPHMASLNADLAGLAGPGGLPEKSDPWTLLEWSVEGQQLVVRNDSRYVVRLYRQVNVIAANTNLMLPNTYILPGQMHRLELPRGSDLGSEPSVRIYPASACGSAVKPYDVVLKRR
ncbi:hypothetical protein ACQKPE_04435 [Pseudomonas sp. NPDC089554]|uniref:hypothetical protein n=1 Tax=Pseudomonas sp. NPDC089554 TaxID=3390653 RepID=UPI003D064F2F